MAQFQQFPKVAVSACVIRGGEVLMIQRAKPPLVAAWSLPGGHVEPGETTRAAARRELAEETGVEADLEHLAGLYDIIRHNDDGTLAAHFVLACYAGVWRAGEPVAGSDALTARFVAFHEVPIICHMASVLDAVAHSRRLLKL